MIGKDCCHGSSWQAEYSILLMRTYFLRRLLLLPPTLLGITLLVFVITRFVPGGPLEQAIMEMQQVDAATGVSAGGGKDQALSEEQLAQLRAQFGFDKPVLVAYGHWLLDLLRGDLGTSIRYHESVWTMISERFPVSLFYGGVTLLVTYAVCIPLGILKAVKHRSWIDSVSSLLILMGYAVPGFALGALLLLFFAIQWPIFPLGGFTSYNFDELSWWEKGWDVWYHAALPLCCYLISTFAVTTLLMKNNLMDHLAADYMRTAAAKGLAFSRAVWQHGLRNAMIPIATTFGQNITLLVSGSFLVEFIFDIDGFGLLGLESVLQRDYPVVMGIVFLSSLLLLLGNILSDLLVSMLDPRIRFQ